MLDFANQSSRFYEKQTRKSTKIMQAIKRYVADLQDENHQIMDQLDAIDAYKETLDCISESLSNQYRENTKFIENCKQL